MTSLKKNILNVTLALTLCVLAAGGAQAALLSWPGTVSGMTTMENFLSGNGATASSYTGGALSGTYYVTPLAFEAEDTIRFRSAGATLFTNKNLPSEFGQVKTANFSLADYFDVTKNNVTSVNDFTTNPTFPAVKVLELTKNWTLSNGLTLSAGTLILGLNDGGSPDGDYDDFILAASRTAPTPIPGAVWLLGSGLLGVMGFKRTRKADKA